ncbi:hypothetical protein [Photobacterium rosenbergii]|uniref:Uncharacterized protein n=1 Tax=Photobacterium rosenbergii TaxID=294936 RepID=A0ABU3ZGL9_9GAMM|nr:hypothetical protein [Photobacterium rosenbergii]MDV5169256.1 hypothetical protein [Photobacterium rosenbergii]
MKKTAFVIISALFLSSPVLANSVLDYHLSTVGERDSLATIQLEKSNLGSMSVMDVQLHNSGEANMPAGHKINGTVNDSSQSVFEYHLSTID